MLLREYQLSWEKDFCCWKHGEKLFACYGILSDVFGVRFGNDCTLRIYLTSQPNSKYVEFVEVRTEEEDDEEEFFDFELQVEGVKLHNATGYYNHFATEVRKLFEEGIVGVYAIVTSN